MIKWIEEINTAGKKVLLRLDLSVPILDGKFTNDFQIRRSLKTLEKLNKDGAKTVIITHAEGDEIASLKFIFEYLSGLFPTVFLENYLISDIKENFSKLDDGGFLLLGNIRKFSEEKENNEDFARGLATLGDIYVNDAFAVSHREHASIVGIPKYIPSYGGYLLKDEIENLSKSFTPKHPFLFVLGGAKFETKIPLIKKFVDIADTVFVGGAIANNFFRCEGFEIGKSLVCIENPDVTALINRVLLPLDVVVKDENGKVRITTPSSVKSNETIVDSGPLTNNMLKEKVEEANMVVWNGPLGYYEGGFSEGSEKLAIEITKNKGYSILGGGDTISVIKDLHIENEIDFVSTGGGAMLEFLAKGTLPGIEALK